MEPTHPGQLKFLDHVKKIIPRNVSLVDELADLLKISNDSAYRRLRGETSLSYEEISLICSQYKISFDALNETSNDVVNFKYQELEETQEDFGMWFNSIKDDLRGSLATSAGEKHLTYTAQGIPIFHYFKYKLLTAFKLHYWMRTILNVPEFQEHKFIPEEVQNDLIKSAFQFHFAYKHVPSTEIWTDTTVTGVIQQIKFYWESGVFKSEEDALNICNELREVLNMVEHEAQLGYKEIFHENKTKERGAPFFLYFSEIEFENNCIMLESGDIKTVYLGHLSFRSIKTNHINYCNETYLWLNNLKKKSHLISGTSETTRYKFFKRCHRKLDQLVNAIESE